MTELREDAAPLPLVPRDRPRAPIFVRGLSRSGGTLMVTILDAHPDVAMSYELYPTLLASCDVADEPSSSELCRRLVAASSLKAAAGAVSDRGVKVFISRCGRGGLDRNDLLEVLEAHLAAGLDLGTPENRLRFIESCCIAKMRKTRKQRWGLKCTGEYDLYRKVFAGAYFLDMLRDGRDVLASQLDLGTFDKGPRALAQSWVKTHERFCALVEDPAVNAYLVRYEALAFEPELELRRICEFLGLAFDPAMLRFHEHDLTIYKSSHISMEQISQPVTSARVGRWRRDLPIEALLEFEAVAGPLLQHFGYEMSTDADRSARNRDHLPSPPGERSRLSSLAATLRQHFGGLLRR
jgi:hypothetical protein